VIGPGLRLHSSGPDSSRRCPPFFLSPATSTHHNSRPLIAVLCKPVSVWLDLSLRGHFYPVTEVTLSKAFRRVPSSEMQFFSALSAAFPGFSRGKTSSAEGPKNPRRIPEKVRWLVDNLSHYPNLKAKQETGSRQLILKNFVLNDPATRLFSSR
jgi:hypothetical protein